MPTRLKRPPFWRPLALTVALLGFQAYLGYSAISGQFGIESREEIIADIEVLEDRSAALQAEIAFGAPDEMVPLLPRMPSLRWLQSTWAGVTPLLARPR